MASKDAATIDTLLVDLGGCGIFQWLMVALVYSSFLPGAWTLIFMAFGVYNPGWRCDSPMGIGGNETMMTSQSYENDTTDSYPRDNLAFQTSCEGYSTCQKVVYNDESSTIVTQWNLACDNFYIPSTMISIQMVGGMLGTFLAGLLSSWLGRKPAHYLMLFIHAVLNLIMAFSVNWQMFAAFSFLGGISGGCVLTSSFMYPVEFVINKCRSVMGGLPMWTLGCLAFSLTAMVLKDWRHVHIVTAIFTLATVLPVFFAPESMRWLAVNGKIEKAQRVARKIAKINQRDEPNMDVITVIAEEEGQREKGKPKINVLDLYRRKFIKRTLVTSLFWTSNSIVYYGIVYGIKSLSGNFYLNLMITTCITTISYPLAPIFANTCGRKFGMVFFMALAIGGLVGLVILSFYPLSSHNGLAQLILIFAILTCIDGEWCVSLVFTAELFPTAIRSLGFSHAGGVARIGGVIAPFLIPKDENTFYISHSVMAVCLTLAAVAIMFLPETNKKEMSDSMGLEKSGSEKEKCQPFIHELDNVV